MSKHTQTGTLTRFRVTFHCGVDEVRELDAIDAQDAQKQVEKDFPEGQGWYVISVEEVNPKANLEPGTSDDAAFAFPIF